MSSGNWGLISVESTNWMSVWAARICSTAVSDPERNSKQHPWCELPTRLRISSHVIQKHKTGVECLNVHVVQHITRICVCVCTCCYVTKVREKSPTEINCQWSRTNEANLCSRAGNWYPKISGRAPKLALSFFISCLLLSPPYFFCSRGGHTVRRGQARMYHFSRNIISASFGEGYINLNPLSAANTPPRRRRGGFCYFYLIISRAYSGVRIHPGWQVPVPFESPIGLFFSMFCHDTWVINAVFRACLRKGRIAAVTCSI